MKTNTIILFILWGGIYLATGFISGSFAWDSLIGSFCILGFCCGILWLQDKLEPSAKNVDHTQTQDDSPPTQITGGHPILAGGLRIALGMLMVIFSIAVYMSLKNDDQKTPQILEHDFRSSPLYMSLNTGDKTTPGNLEPHLSSSQASDRKPMTHSDKKYGLGLGSYMFFLFCFGCKVVCDGVVQVRSGKSPRVKLK